MNFATFCYLIFNFLLCLEDFFLPTTFTHTHDPRPLPTTHDPRHLATLVSDERGPRSHVTKEIPGRGQRRSRKKGNQGVGDQEIFLS